MESPESMTPHSSVDLPEQLSFYILEDNPQDLSLVIKTIHEHFPKAKVENGIRIAECIRRLNQNPFTLIIADLNLPDSRGYDTFQTLRFHFPEIPIFILTVHGTEDLAVRAIAEGASDYFFKDYLLETPLLGQALRNALERARILKNLKSVQQGFRDILNSCSDGIVVTDLGGKVVFQNTMAKTLMGSLSLGSGDRFPLTPNPDCEQSLTFENSTHESSDPISLSVKTTRYCGEMEPGYCLTLRDVSENKKVLDTLIAAQRSAESSNLSKTLFLANISHEIRTPLNGIMGAATLLEDTPLTQEQSDYVNTINDSSDFLLTLINDLLDLSRIEAGTPQIELATFNLRDVIRGCVDQFGESLSSTKVSFTVDVCSDIPSLVIGDAWRIRQILTNLLGNAFKFTETGSVTLSVLLQNPKDTIAKPESEDQRTLLFQVIDTGIGISKNQLSSLFRPFVQGDMSITKKYGGSGLGLAISKRLAEIMGGSLTVTSTPNQGSIFTLALPMPIPNSNIRPELPDESRQSHSGETLSPETESQSSAPHRFLEKLGRAPLILVVDDHPINSKLTATMLKKLNCRVIAANSGLEALEQAAHTSADLILMDIQMPGIDGYETTKRLRELPQYKDTPIIAMTAYVFPQNISQCKESGMNGVLKKPFVLQQMKQTLKQWLLSQEVEPQAVPPTLPLSEPLPILDLSLVKEWKDVLGEDPSFQKNFLNIFFSTSEEILKEIESAIQIQNKEDLKRLIHRLKGSSGHIGAARLVQYLENAETSLKERDSLPENLNTILVRELALLKTALSEIDA